MAGSLFGEIVNSCDATTGFSAGGISADDDFAEGTGALGAKVSNTYTAFYTTSLGATAPYDFSGAEAGQHFIMWFSSKSKLDPVSGYRLIMGNGTSRGEWDVPPVTSELKRNGAFVTRVIDPAQDFSRIAAGSWSLTGNPAQLSNITQMGGGLQTSVSIMGSFNNAQVDQMVIGWGVRLSGGTSGSPDSFEVARAADEDGGIWGWSQGGLLKGGVYIGPETGTSASVFVSSGETRVFASAPVAVGFYRIEARGVGTDVTLDGDSISAEDPAVARWDYTVGPDTGAWSDTGGVYSGVGVMTLESGATVSNIKITDINSIIQNGCAITDFNISSPNTASGVALITADNLDIITGCSFASSGTGHAVDLGTIAATASVTWRNTDSGYAATDGATGNETILVDVAAGQALTINVEAGASIPTVRNVGTGSFVVNNSVPVVITVVDDLGVPLSGARVYVALPSAGAQIINGSTDANGEISISYSGATPQVVVGWVRSYDLSGVDYTEGSIQGTIRTGSGLDLTIPMEAE